MWKCPLCATNHASRAGKARKYFFSNVCAVFTSYSIEQKSKFLGKNFLCKVCSGPKDQSDHPKGQDCPRVNQLGCKLCKKDPENNRWKSHNQEIHTHPKQAGYATRGGGRRRGGGRGGPKGDDGGPGAGHGPAGGFYHATPPGYQLYPYYQAQGPYNYNGWNRQHPYGAPGGQTQQQAVNTYGHGTPGVQTQQQAVDAYGRPLLALEGPQREEPVVPQPRGNPPHGHEGWTQYMTWSQGPTNQFMTLDQQLMGSGNFNNSWNGIHAEYKPHPTVN